MIKWLSLGGAYPIWAGDLVLEILRLKEWKLSDKEGTIVPG